MKIRILKVAQIEFNEAKEYYEIEQTGLGKKFEEDIKEGIKRIYQFPNAWPLEKQRSGDFSSIGSHIKFYTLFKIRK